MANVSSFLSDGTAAAEHHGDVTGVDDNDDSSWRTRVRALVVHPSAAKLLAVRVNGRLEIPEFELPGSPWVGEPGPFTSALRQQVGLDADLLRCIHQSEDGAARSKAVTLVFAARTDTRADDMVWASGADLGNLPTEFAEMVTPVLSNLVAGVRNDRMPWTNRGWHAEAEEWLLTSMRANGTPVVGAIEPVVSWELSCVMRAQTAAGLMYFKTWLDTPLFAPEGSVVTELARLFPDEIPTPVAVDLDRRYLVVRDAGPIVGWHAPIETREEVIRAAARMQKRSAPHVDRLLAAGCLDRRLDWLAERASSWLSEVDLSRWLPAEDVAQLRSAGERLAGMCAELAALPVPHTIVHGDLHFGNVSHGEHGFVIFDWTDGCIAHPFLDMIVIMFEEDEAVRDRLRDAYLAEWSAVASAEDLRRGWQLAQPLTALNHAISYLSVWSDLDSDVADSEFGSAIPRFLRRLVETTPANA